MLKLLCQLTDIILQVSEHQQYRRNFQVPDPCVRVDYNDGPEIIFAHS